MSSVNDIKADLLEAAFALAKAYCFLDIASKNNKTLKEKLEPAKREILDIEMDVFELSRVLTRIEKKRLEINE